VRRNPKGGFTDSLLDETDIDVKPGAICEVRPLQVFGRAVNVEP